MQRMSRTKQIAKNLFMGAVYAVLLWAFVSAGALGLVLLRYELGNWEGSLVAIGALTVAFAFFFTMLEGRLDRVSKADAEAGAEAIVNAAKTDPKVKSFLQLAKRVRTDSGDHLYFDKDAAKALARHNQPGAVLTSADQPGAVLTRSANDRANDLYDNRAKDAKLPGLPKPPKS